MANVKYTISFLSSDQELIQFVEDKRMTQNFSFYVRELIRNDMDGQGDPKLEKIYEYVIKRIKVDGFSIKGLAGEKVNDFIDEADRDVILDLF